MITNVQFFNKNTNAWEEMNAVYPITFEEKLDREFDSGELITVGDERHEPYTPVRIVIGDTQATADTFYFYGNTAQKWSPSGVMQNSVRLVEPTKILQGRFVDGLAVDQPLQGTQKTLKDVIERVLRVTPLRTLGELQEFILTTDSEIVSILQTTISPEYKWSSQTSLWEVLCDIGAYIDAMPRLKWNTAANKFNIVTFDFINQQKAKIENLAYYGKLTNFDESQYCTMLESVVDNLAVKDERESTLFFPNYYGYVTPRTNDLRLTDQNCEIILDKRISQLSRFLMHSKGIIVTYAYSVAGHNHEWIDLELETGKLTHRKINGTVTPIDPIMPIATPMPSIDLTEYVKEYDEWQTQNFFPDANNPTGTKTSKNNTIYWKRYGNTITLLNTAFGVGITGVFQKSVFGYLLETWTNTDLFNFVPDAFSYENKNFKYDEITFNGQKLTLTSSADPRSFEFQVLYIPFDDGGVVRTPKSDMLSSIDYIQPYNQRAEINDSSAFGLNMQGTVNRMGVDCLTAPARYRQWGEIQDIGDVYIENGQEYIITNVKYMLTNTDSVTVVYSLSKDWNYLSQYFNIDKKFRSWNIPSQNIQRNLHYSDYCVVSHMPPNNETNDSSLTLSGMQAIADSFKNNITTKEPINTCWVSEYKDTLTFATLSASSLGFGNSIRLMGKTKNNLSAGVNIVKAEGSNKYCQDVYYCRADGTMLYLNALFAREMGSNNPDLIPFARKADHGIPAANYPSEILVNFNVYVDKSPSENLAINYQLFFVSECPTTIITNKFVVENSIVKFGTGGNTLTVWGIKKPLPKMSQIITSQYAESLTNTVVPTNPSTNYFSISVGNIGSQFIGWAISQGQDLFIAQYRDANGNLPTTLYFNFKHSIK